jgi:hypothetical protein
MNPFGHDRGIQGRRHNGGFMHIGGEPPGSGDIGRAQPCDAQAGVRTFDTLAIYQLLSGTREAIGGSGCSGSHP